MAVEREVSEVQNRREAALRFWESAAGFWRGPGAVVAWALIVGLILLVVLQTTVQYLITVWNKEFFNALEKKDAAAVWQVSLFLPLLVVASTAVGVSSVFGRMRTQLLWRRHLTNGLLDHWLWNGRYYQLAMIDGDHNNAEMRIAEDGRIATEAPIDFAVGLFAAFLSAVTFITVLWRVGGGITIGGEGGVYLPGYLVIAAVIYSGITTTAMLVFARRFVSVVEGKNGAEADFRYALIRLRENGESIALLGGEEEERAGLASLFGGIRRAWVGLCGQLMRTTTIYQSNLVLAPVAPLVLCAPKFLAGTMSLGDVMQAATAFVAVQWAFNWLVENYPRLADWKASAIRVGSLLRSLDRLEAAEEPDVAGRISRIEDDGPGLHLVNVSVTLGDGTAVLSETDVGIGKGERVLVIGESGSGKSTLLRALAGLWPWGGGEVRIRRGASLLFMPQKPYIPTGTLKRVATYPGDPDATPDEAVRQAMTDAELDHLAERIGEKDDWDRILSGGEKQRIAFARMFVHRPDIIVMDEATAALDSKTQDVLMRKLIELLPQSAIVSVGHRTELEAFHDRRLTLERHADGARLVRDEALRASRRTAGCLARRLAAAAASGRRR